MSAAPISSNSASSTTQHIFQIQNIPILLTYPTLLLAASLVVEQSLFTDDVSSKSQWIRVVLSLLVTPVFLGSVLSVLSSFVRNLTTKSSLEGTLATRGKSLHSESFNHDYGHTHDHTHTHREGEKDPAQFKTLLMQTKPLVTLITLFSTCWLLDPIRTVSLTLTLMQSASVFSLPHLCFVAVCFIFDLIEVIVRSGLSVNYEGLQGVNYGWWLILGYSFCFFNSQNLSLVFQGQADDSCKVRDKDWKQELVFPSASALVSGLILVFFLKYVNISMVLITVGCGLILQLSQSESLEFQFNALNIIISSLLSYTLEILAFKKQFHIFLIVVEVLIICLIYFLPIESAIISTKAKKQTSPSLVTQLLTHPKTKPIFSFLLLNTTFMFVQLVYSFRSQSLGLLSDSLHMALDSTSLLLGLIATVMAEEPPSRSFPFGLRKLETLAGFANGVLLIGIVFGILVEAVQRLFWPVEIQRTGELLIVAALGLVVNIIGIFAFNHGHDHGHAHSHGHSHGSDTGNGDDSQDHDNENMRGIFLHILADTLGSFGVVVSTVLIQVFKTPIFDPISSLFIAILIFASALPLIRSSAARLLLNLNDKDDDLVKDLLSQVMSMPGVVSYTTPRFWSESTVLEDDLAGSGESNSVKISQPPLTAVTVDDNEVLSGKVRSRGETFSFPVSNDAASLDAPHAHDLDHGHPHSHSEHSHSHSHDHSHESSSCSEEEAKFKLIGFIHIQHLDGENSTIIKKRVERVFENAKVKCCVQVEAESERCWCRVEL